MPPELPAGGHRRGQGAAQAPPGHRRGRALAVRRPRLRRSPCSPTAPPATRTSSRTAIAEGNQLARAVREVATGGSVLDPKIVEALVQPVTDDGGLTADEEQLLHAGRRGPPDQGDRRRRSARPPAAIADAVEELFLKLSEGASTGHSRRAQAAAHAAPGDRRPRGAGRDAEPPAAGRPGREGARRGPRASARPRSSTVTVLMSRHPRLLGHRRDAATRRSSRTSSTSTAPR